MMNKQAFYEYVASFYGKGGVYDIDATVGEIKHATNIHISRVGKENFAADSFDRESVRDIIELTRDINRIPNTGKLKLVLSLVE